VEVFFCKIIYVVSNLLRKVQIRISKLFKFTLLLRPKHSNLTVTFEPGRFLTVKIEPDRFLTVQIEPGRAVAHLPLRFVHLSCRFVHLRAVRAGTTAARNFKF
jgi:hypothetical protein